MSASVNWEHVKQKLIHFKDEITSQSKRAIKKEVPKSEATRQEIRDTLVKLFNNTVTYLSAHWVKLDNSQKIIAKDIFAVIRDKVARAFEYLNVKYKVPVNCLEKIDPLILEETFIETATEEDSFSMAMTKIEFFNLASKIIPQEYDGSPDKLQTFLDALNLLNENSNNHAANAVAFVKTRLTGKARGLITTETSIEDVITALKTGIKSESSQSLTAKLLNCKQNHKDSVNYAAEVESLAEKLKNAFVSEGVPYALAAKYATDHTVRSLSQNTISDRARLIMEAGTFNTVQEAMTKFVNINANSQPNTSNVFYARNKRESFSFGNSRGRGQNHNRGQNFRTGQRRDYRDDRRRFEGNRRNFRRGYSNNYTRAVRTVATTGDSENESPPQRAPRLGDEM